MVQVEQPVAKAIENPRTAFAEFLERFREKHEQVYVILGPPRSSSTAFARVFWEHPSIGYYCHEPFDVTYHKKLDLSHVIKAIERPVSLEAVKNRKHKGKQLAVRVGSDHRWVVSIARQPVVSNSLVIKEMTFQIGRNFDLLAAFTNHPLIFVIRDPRLSIASRMRKRMEGGEDYIFPLEESGWNDLDYQIAHCKESNIPYLIVDSADFRTYPRIIFNKVFKKIGLSFSESMLRWQEKQDIELGNLEGAQNHWYKRVLQSTGIEPTNEPVPEVDSFPEANGFRVHLSYCLDKYEMMRRDPNAILV